MEDPQQAARRCDFPWIVTTLEGWLKLVEAILTLITFVARSSSPDSFRGDLEYRLSDGFLVFVATAAFVFVLLHIILRMVHEFEEHQKVFRLFGCFTLAIGIGIAAMVARPRRGEYHVDALMKTSFACGLISAVLFLGEGTFFCLLYAPIRRTEETTMEEGEADEFVPPLHRE